MKVLIDTPIWSFVLRRKRGVLSGEQQRQIYEWGRLVRTKQLLLIGPIRQEVLSGIRDARQFERIREELRAFPDAELETRDFELAGEFSNRCRTAGVASSAVDMLICAAAVRRDAVIFTTDGDFVRYSRLLEMRLHQVPVGGSI